MRILLKATTKTVPGQKGGLLNFLGLLVKNGAPLIKNVLTPLAKSVLIALGLTAAVSVTDVAI